MSELTPQLRPDSDTPIYEQLYQYIKNEIVSGNLPKGMRLPSTRSLAAHLCVSRGTVSLSYDQLLSEGYIESIPCRGFFVNDLEGLYNITAPVASARDKAPTDARQYTYDFSPSGINLDNFPYNTWRRINKNILSADRNELFNIGDSQGEYDFRATIANYLHQSRGVVCHPDQIIIGAGNEYLLMILHQLLGRDTIFAMENPTYSKAHKTLTNLGHTIVPIDMDRSGISISKLNASPANVAYVTPSHQYPLGIVMPVKRRTELLKWSLAASDRYIIEDDYDSEFRYKGRPIPALQGNDTYGRVIYLGTFSKSIAPSIRMSYMVLPKSLLDIYHNTYGFLSCTVPRIDQAIVNEFISEGYYERHLNKMRAHYKTLHDLLLNELDSFRPYFTISGENAGLHILLTSRRCLTEEQLLKASDAVEVRTYPLSQYYIDGDTHNTGTVILGYATLTPQQITQGIQALRQAWLQ